MDFLEYIACTPEGGQYINTGHKPTDLTKVELDYDLTAQSTQSPIFGGRTAYQNSMFSLWTLTNATGFQNDYGTGVNNVTKTAHGRHVLIKDKNLLYLDGALIQTLATHNTYTSNSPITIFAINVNNSIMSLSTYKANWKLYSCKIYEDNNLIRNYIPARDNEGNVGLYDLVNEVFYKNAGIGTFVAGPKRQNIISVISNLDFPNDTLYSARIFPVNNEGQMQTSLKNQIAYLDASGK